MRIENSNTCFGVTVLCRFNLFGDILVFNTTYRKNKYDCPLVVFFGFNHHNQTIVFATTIIANEIEETCVWLLENFLEAMKGKLPLSVITNGDLAMKTSIRRVFPNSHHRLCIWHILCNATTNLGNVEFNRVHKMLAKWLWDWWIPKKNGQRWFLNSILRIINRCYSYMKRWTCRTQLIWEAIFLLGSGQRLDVRLCMLKFQGLFSQNIIWLS